MKKLMNQWRELMRDESGAAAVEYGLLAGLIAVVIVGGVTTLGQNLGTIFTNIGGTRWWFLVLTGGGGGGVLEFELLGSGEGALVRAPKLGACFNAARFNEALTVGAPVLRGRHRGGEHQLGHPFQKMRLAELFAHPGFWEGVLLCQLVGQSHHFGCFAVG